MYHADVAQLVERDLAKVEVAGSSPVVRSKQTPPSYLVAAQYEPASPSKIPWSTVRSFPFVTRFWVSTSAGRRVESALTGE